MINLFLEVLGGLESSQASAIIAFIAAFFVVSLIIGIVLYVYVSFAYMAIARKNKQSSPGIAWIPAVGPLIVAYRGSKMHWWPWLLLIGAIIPLVNVLFMLAFAVFQVIWHWKLFEAINKPGWWAIFMIIPILNIVFLVFIGIAAWSDK